MSRKSIRLAGLTIASAVALAACGEVGTVVLWPWVEADNTQTASLDNPPPPTQPVNPTGDPTPPAEPAPDAAPQPNANEGAPDDGTPFIDKPVDPNIPISDSAPPVSADTGQPVTLPPAPTEETSPPPASEPTPEPTPGPSPEPTPTPEPAPATPSFYYFRPSNLEPGTGIGTPEASVLVPDMMFPIKDAPAFPQSQVYRWGGGVKGGDQCDARNFRAPWRDNYCEKRSSGSSSFCNAGAVGAHLGQDIRVGTPEGCNAERTTKAKDRARYEVVATEDGIVSNVGSYSVSIRADSGGRIYRYLHLNMAKLKVAQGQAVKKGDVIGYVSNDFGGTPTTLHLHFEIKLNTTANGWQYAPPYASLLEAYKRRENNPGAQVADDFLVASTPR
jgi:hypothetical protein